VVLAQVPGGDGPLGVLRENPGRPKRSNPRQLFDAERVLLRSGLKALTSRATGAQLGRTSSLGRYDGHAARRWSTHPLSATTMSTSSAPRNPRLLKSGLAVRSRVPHPASPPRHFVVRAVDRVLTLGGTPLVMGVLNASPESFSDGEQVGDVGQQLERAAQLLHEGADLIDVGGESAVTNRAPISSAAEIERVVPLIERIVGELGAVVSVDTYKPEVAAAAIAAGAVVVNDISGLRDVALADVCARTGAALVLMHTRSAPKQRFQGPHRYTDVVGDVVDFLGDRIRLAVDRGVPVESLILDPGPDFAKTAAQTITTLQHLEKLHAFRRPLLIAVSRKDFIGALTGRRPSQRLAGTLAALNHCLDAGGHIVRVHDVAAVRDFLTVRAAMRGDLQIDDTLLLDDAIRYERSSGPSATAPL
jgi:dihydropteroate synthase